MLEINTEEKIDVKVNGKVFKVAIPSMKELVSFEKEIKAIPAEKAPEFYADYFEKRGLGREATDKFTVNHWKMVIEELTGVKKN